MWPRTVTGRCRLVLALSPILLPCWLFLSAVEILAATAKAFGESTGGILAADWHVWYREVYRPARYGSVYDPK